MTLARNARTRQIGIAPRRSLAIARPPLPVARQHATRSRWSRLVPHHEVIPMLATITVTLLIACAIIANAAMSRGGSILS